jgi:hypothetical protein
MARAVRRVGCVCIAARLTSAPEGTPTMEDRVRATSKKASAVDCSSGDATVSGLLQAVRPGRERRRQQRRELQASLRKLDPHERVVLARRYGLRGTPETLEQIGRGLGLSRSHVRSIENSALARLASLPRRSVRLRGSWLARPIAQRGGPRRGRSRTARRRRTCNARAPGRSTDEAHGLP